MSSMPASSRLWIIAWFLLVLVVLAFIDPIGGDANPVLLATPNYLPLMFQAWRTATPTPIPGFLLITEVLADPDGEEPEGEWVEIYNAGETALDLSRYKVGDEETARGLEGMFQFPPGSTLPAGKAIVIANQTEIFYRLFRKLPDYELYDTHQFIPDMIKYSNWSGGSIELSNGGDEVLILNEFDQRVDSLSWGTSRLELDPPPPAVAQGHSLERKPANRDTNLAADWIEQNLPNPGKVDLSLSTPTPTPQNSGTPSPIAPSAVLISEVLYDPEGVTEPQGEWFEIYNPGPEIIYLDGVRIGDEETPGQGEGMLVFPPGTSIADGQTLVIAQQASVFSSAYGLSPDFEIIDTIPQVPQMLRDSLWGTGSVNLSNDGDELLILDARGVRIDAVSWGSSPLGLDPPVPAVSEGHSIERYPPGNDTDSAQDWRDQPSPDPKRVDLTLPTPTPSPTATPDPTPVPVWVINEIHADPHPVLGDANGDGVVNSSQDEFVEIVNISGSLVDLSGWGIYDAVGLRHIFPQGSVVFDHCALVVFGGGQPVGGFGGSLVQVASSGGLGLNNDGDTLRLQPVGQTEGLSYTYGPEGGNDQSLTRNPDITGLEPLVKHSTVSEAGGALFSPGVQLDGSNFSGCGTRSPIEAFFQRIMAWMILGL